MDMDALIVLAQAAPSEKTLGDEDWRTIFTVVAGIGGLILVALGILMTLVLRFYRRWRWGRALLAAGLTAPVCLGLFFVIARTRAALTDEDYAALSSSGGLPALLAIIIPFAVAFLWPRRRVSPPAEAAPEAASRPKS